MTLLREQLIRAIGANDTAGVRTALEAGADPNERGGKHERTPFYYAPRRCDEETLRLLLEYKADPNIVDKDGYGPLHMAVTFRRFAQADILLAAGARIDLQDKGRVTPLHCAYFKDLRHRDAAGTEFLLSRGANADIPVDNFEHLTVRNMARKEARTSSLAFDILRNIERIEDALSPLREQAQAHLYAAARASKTRYRL